MNQHHKIIKSIFLIGLILVLCKIVPGQTIRQFNILKDEIQAVLPPLSALIDSALAKDPYVSFRNKQITVNSYKLNTERAQWFRNLGFQADIRYGTFDNFSTNTAEGQNPATFATTRNELHYGVGAYIKFPLYDLVDHRNKLDLAKVEIGQAQDMQDVQRSEVRQLVIHQYNDLITKQRILQIKAKYAETSRMNMLMADKEFINGTISLAEYSRLAELATNAEEGYEQVKMDFRTSYMILEETVKFKLNVKFELP